jgi:hypothetical protein
MWFDVDGFGASCAATKVADQLHYTIIENA